ncbi:RecT family recombinase [Pontibacterium sp.]|uniref:RecT family recombinase n=1 Tax=Pontibacterium sp. TaxID=2036026 RepID=UPI0035626315
MNQEASNVVSMQQGGAPMEMTDPSATHTANMLMNPMIMQQLSNFAAMMASGKSTIPQHLRGNQGDCMAIAMQAAQWGMNPYAVAQKTHLVNGTLGYEAQLVNAVINSMAPTKDRIHYEWFGDWSGVIGNFVEKTSSKGNKYNAPNWTLKDEKGLGVRVWATLKGEEEPRILELLLSQAQVRNSTLWASDPKQQLAYLALKRWARLYCPDVILGVYTPDEFEKPSRPAEREVNPSAAPSSLQNKINPRKQAEEPEAKAEPEQNWQPIVDQWVEVFNSCETLEGLAVCRTDAEAFQQENNPPAALWNSVFVAYGNTKKALEAGANPQTGEAV